MEPPIGLDEESFDRVAETVRRVEGLPPRRQGQQRPHRGSQAAPHNWITVTSATPATITLQSGSTLQGYPAKWSYFDGAATGWTPPGGVVWYYPPNGEVPGVNVRMECRCIGADTSGVTMWSAVPDIAIATCDPDTGDPAAATYPVAAGFNVDEKSGLSYLAASGIPTPPFPMTLAAQPASMSHFGVVTYASQGFAGAKKFQDGVEVFGSLTGPGAANDPGGSLGGLSGPGTLALASHGDVLLTDGSQLLFSMIPGLGVVAAVAGLGITNSTGTPFWMNTANGLAVTLPGGQNCLSLTSFDTIPRFAIQGLETPLYLGQSATVTLSGGQVLTFVGGILVATAGSGISSGGSGSGPAGPSFLNLCPGQTFNASYALTISGGCAALNGTYTIVWNGANWTWSGTLGGVAWTWNMHDTGGTPSPGTTVTGDSGGASWGQSGSTSFTCPPTASGSGSFVLAGGSPLCPGATVNWSFA